MVGIVTGQGTGLQRSSANVLGARGQIGSALQGWGGDGVFVNAASGNLVVTRQDEILLGLGPDIGIDRTYNSQGSLSDGDNGDNWRIGAYRRIVGANGSTSVTRVDWDGSETVYVQSGGSYVGRDGAGAYDTLAWDGAQWRWTDGDSRTTETYDASGKLVATRDADGNSLTYSYSGSLITRIANQNGEYTDLVYGGTGGTQLLRIAAQTSTGPVRVRYSYDGSNRLCAVTVDLSPGDGTVADGRSYVTTYGYDGASKRVASISQSDGSRLDIGYTQAGSDYRVTKLTQTVSSGVTRVTGLYYDIAGRTTTITDPLGGQMTMRYDAAGNLVQITHPKPAPGVSAPTTSFAYNASGDVVSMTEAGRTTVYEYDSQGNMTLSRDAAGSTVTRTYGSRNELLTSTEYLVANPDISSTPASSRITTRYAYDSENHLRFTVSGDGRVTEYRYNAAGTLASTLSYAGDLYNTAGLGASSSIAESALASWAAGIADKTTIQRVDTAYDFRGNVSSVTSYSRTLSDGTGDLSSTYTRNVYVYDPAGNLLSRQKSGAANSETFLYDGLNRLASSTDAAGAVTTLAFNDAATTTTVSVAGGLTRVAVFNKAGDRISLTESGGDIATTTTTEAYDALGRLRMQTDATGRSTYFVYDAAGRIAADVSADGAITEYGYDAGNRLVKTVKYMNKLSSSQIALLAGFSAGGTGGATAGGVGGTVGSNLMSNGSFEQSGSYAATATGRSNTTLPGWTKANPETFEQVISGQMGVAASEGSFWLDLESVANTGVVAYGSNLLVNGSFGQSGTYVQTSTGRSNTTLPGWAKYNPETFEQVQSGQMGVSTHDGGFWLDLESIPTTGPQAVGPNLLINGSFDISGDFIATQTGRANTTLPGWSKDNPQPFEQVDPDSTGIGPIDGQFFLDLDSVPNAVGLVEGPNLIVNGSFEQSAASFTATATGRYNDPTLDIPGWVKINAQGFEQVSSGVGDVEATDGDFYLDMEANGDAESRMDISQTISGLAGGQQLTLKFDYANIAGTYPDADGNVENSGALEVYWNGHLLGRVTSSDPAMATKGFPVTTLDGDNVLRFREIGVTDGTGVYLDNVRLFALAPPSNLIVNGSFEQSAASYTATATGRYNDPTLAIPGWTKTNEQGFEQVSSGANGIAATHGSFYLDMEANGDFDSRMDISQTIAGLTAGKQLTLTFDFANIAGTVPDGDGNVENSGALEVYWNGFLAGRVSSYDTALTTKTFTLTSISGNNTLRFREIGVTDGVGVYLDNVQLIETAPTSVGGNMDIYQTVGGLAAGQVMQLQFDHARLANMASASFEVWWNDTLVAAIADGKEEMRTYSYFVTASDGDNTLRFKGTGTVDAAGAAIDNVRLFATQSPPHGGNMDIYQTVANLTAGQVLQLQFDHANRTTAESGSFEVWWNDTLVATISETGATMRTKTFLVNAIAGSNTIRFKGLGTVDADGASIDNVRLLATQGVTGGGNMDISQTVGGLAAGQVMQLQFDHANRTTAASGTFEVWWNNALVATIAEAGTAMQTKTYYVNAIAGSNTLRFRSLGPVDAEGASLDNVRLFAMQSGGPGAATPADPLAGLRPAASAGDDWSWNIYDSANRLIETIDGAGRATIFSYDAASRLVSSTAYATPFDAGYISFFKSSTPVMPYLPATNSATDRRTRSFYDSEGRLVGTLDGAGGLTQIFHDAAGQKIREIAYANPASENLRLSGTFAQLLASVGTSASDRRSDSVYDQRGLLRFTIDGAGHPTEFIHDAAGHLIRTVDHAGAIATAASYSLAYVQGQISATGLAANAANRVTRSVYDAAGRVAFTIDAEGATCAYAYDQLGNPIKTTHFAVPFAAAGDQTLASMQSWAAGQAGNAANRVTRQVYDAASRHAYTIDAEGFVTEQRYDPAGRVTQTIRYPSAYSVADGVTKAGLAAQIGGLPAGAVVTGYAYDSAGRLSDVTDGEGVVTHYVYDALGQVTDQTVAFGTADAATLRRVYDAAGRVVSETLGFGTAEAATIGYGYDALGNLLSVTDARGFTTVNVYDALGRVVRTTAPIDASTSAVVSRVYNRFGDAVQSTDARGFSSYSYYDRLGRLVATRDAEDYVTETAYSVFGDLTGVTRRYNRANNAASPAVMPTFTAHSSDATTSFAYDRLGRLTRATDAEGHYEEYTLDAFGQQVSVRNKLGGTTTNLFDRRGLLVAETLPLSSVRSDGSVQAWTVTNRFEYDSRGNRTRMIEAFGLSEQRTSTYVYDKLDRLVETRADAVSVLNPSDHYSLSTVTPTERLAYDRRGNLIETVDTLGARTLFYYDGLNRRVAALNAVGALTTFAHDSNGNVIRSRAYAAAVALPATAGGSPPAEPAGEHRETGFTYDRLNRLLTQSTGGVRTGAWNGASYATSVGTITTSYEYDANGNVIKTTDPNGGVTWASYDRLGRARTSVDAENFLTEWSYDSEGNLLTERRSALRASGVGTPTPLASPHPDDRITHFTYDRNGRRLTEQRMAVSAYRVNKFGALTYTPGTATITYIYNGLGEVTRKTEATGEFIDYIYDAAGRLITENRASYTDQDGNFVRPTVDYSYDGLNHLTRTRQGNQFAAAGDHITRNDYGPGGRLASVTDATGSVYSYAYDVGGNVLRESYVRQKSDDSTVAEAILYSRDQLGRTTAQGVGAQNGAGWIRGDVQKIAYNVFGEVSARGLNDLWQEQFDYDRAGRLWRTNSQDGLWRYFIQDGNGNQTLAIESEGTDLANKSLDQVLAIATGNDIHTVGAAYVDGINVAINVYDKRGQAVATRLPKRQLNESGTPVDLVVERGYTAFGETSWETDASGARTDFGYNTMGRTVSVRRPTVSVTLENGTVQNVNPTEIFIYDISGRMIGTVDANGYGTNRMLLAGTGYGDDKGVAVLEFHPDGGIVRNIYDAFGDLRRSTDEAGRVTSMKYDARGRLTEVTRPGGLVENFAYDLLGQRIQHWNNFLLNPVYGPPEQVWVEEGHWDPYLGWVDTSHWETRTPIIGYAPDKQRTDYDMQGRVTSEVAFGGDTTTTTYQWSSALATSGLATFGGWIETTTYMNGRTKVEKSDMFGRVLFKKDLGEHVFEFSYDLAGRLAQRTGGKTLTYAYLNSGLLGSVTTMTGSLDDAHEIARTTYGYDVNGNKVSERFEKQGARWVVFGGGWEEPPERVLINYSDVYQDATATYDALGRMTSWNEAGNATTPAASLLYDYDRTGNVRRTRAQYSSINPHGGAVAGASKDHWYRYDSMNRVVTSKGVLEGGQIHRGDEGVDIRYDASGQRVSTSRTTWETAMVWDPNIVRWDEWGNPQYGDWVQTSYQGETREDYGYDAGGYLASVRIAESGYDDNGDGTVTPTAPPSVGALKSTHSHDLMGRLTRQIDWLGDGTNAAYDRTLEYNEKGQVRWDTTISRQGFDTIRARTGNEFVARNADPVTSYALGAVVYTATETFKNGSSSTDNWTETKNTHVWWDGAMQDHVTHTPNVWARDLNQPGAFDFHTQYNYDALGQLVSVQISDGRPRTVTFTNNLVGQAIRRDETNGSSGAPHEVWYRFDGKQLGFTGNNGTLETDYQTSIENRTRVQGTGAFRFGQSSSPAYADFDQNYSAITSYAQGSAGGSYTVRTGETLSSIAAALWGDGALWYKLAEANGMSAETGLVEGQRLTVPTGILKNHHNAGTFKPYDPGDILGDLSPTTPRPPAATTQKKNKCGIFGQILLVIVAVAVSVLTYGALTSASTGLLASIGAGAVSGAAGAAASQVFGLATGIQNKFDWKAVALGALSGAVGAAAQGIPFLKAGGGKFADFAKDMARGAIASAATQGIGVATGLQGKFSWAGVAAAGVGSGVTGAVSRRLRLQSIEENNRLGNYAKTALAGTAGAIASAATRSIIDGSDFGDNLLASLPGVLGATIGNAILHGITFPERRASAGLAVKFKEIASLAPQAQDPELVDCKPIGPMCQPLDKFGDQPEGSFFKRIYNQVESELKNQGLDHSRKAVDAELLRRYARPQNGVGEGSGTSGVGTGTDDDGEVVGVTTRSVSAGTQLSTMLGMQTTGPGIGLIVGSGGGGRGVAFFGEPSLRYWLKPGSTLGQAGRPFYLMSLEDSLMVTGTSSAARYTGMSPSTKAAWLRSQYFPNGGGNIYGIDVPLQSLRTRRPTLADAMDWPHFLENGRTAVRTSTGPTGGYLLNPTGEFVVPGGGDPPPGSVLFKIGPNGERIPMRTWGAGKATALTYGRYGFRGLGVAGTIYGGYEDYQAINEVYQADSMTGDYSNTRWKAAEVGGGWGGAFVGAKIGAWGGGKVGLLGGPKAWITVPAGAIVGGAIGGYYGYRYGSAGVSWMRPAPSLHGEYLDSPMPNLAPPGAIGTPGVM